ncbi:arginine--tRNA ligase, partial [Candidatus Woesearchaeota archaeon]|nr:arginine--tRNA ligase [Candidatus Woesearchaeota archaeon]
MFKNEIIKLLKKDVIGEIVLEQPPDNAMGDWAFPCFQLSKQQKKSPNIVAQELAKKIKPESFLSKIEARGPYVNFFVNKTLLAQQTLKQIYTEQDNYGRSDVGDGKTVIVEFSSPNIAKPFHIGHLRSTVIGNSVYKMLAFSGYNAVRLNHLGDWGTQFGQLIVAWLKWKDEKKFKKDSIMHLLDLYVRFHDEAKTHPELEDEARQWFKKLEDGDSEAQKLWAKFKHVSLDEFKRIYALLGVEFDSWNGESFYNDKMDAAISKVEKKHLAIMDEGALVVKLDKYGMPALMLKKSDEATTYHTRDLAAALYRIETYKPEKVLYVVGSPQKLHFQQLFKLLELISSNPEKFVHIEFGQYRLPEGKIQTRTGNVIFMEDVMNKTIELAEKTINEKNPKLKNKKEVAHMVGIGAVIFNDLANDRIRDIVFDWDKMLDFEGDTAPYLQYTYARAHSVLRKAAEKNLAPAADAEFETLHTDVEKRLIVLLAQFKDRIKEALANYKPHIIAQYLLLLGRTFNEFYHANPVIQAEKKNVQEARLLLVKCTAQVVKN